MYETLGLPGRLRQGTKNDLPLKVFYLQHRLRAYPLFGLV